jgi:hypothetical protein
MAAMSDVEPKDAGLASGIANTAFMMGGALGLAVLASAASARTGHPITAASLTSGYHLAFLLGAAFALAAAAVGATLLRSAHAGAAVAAEEPALEAA